VNDKYQTGIAKSPTDTIIHLQRNSVISPFLLIATDLCIYLSFFWSGYSEYVFVSEPNNDKIIAQIFSATVF